MHWFEAKLDKLKHLAEDYELAQQQTANDIVNISENLRQKRSAFIESVQALVHDISDIKGITACAAYHDGLILAQSKAIPTGDAFGATIQEAMQAAQQGAHILDLGHIEQIVIVGSKQKVAMLSIGTLVFCIASPKNINLAGLLQNPH
jgi:Uncharacterized distant relative of homeotic protein bithoraxoid